MKHPSITLIVPALCALFCTQVHAVVLHEVKADNAIHFVDCTIPSDTLPTAQSLNLPVFAEQPAEPVSVSVFIMPDGKVYGTPSYKEPEKKALADSIKLSQFTGAQLVGKPAWSSIKFTAESYFYIDPQAVPTTSLKLPAPAFRFEQINLEELSVLAPATEIDQDPSLTFRFSIDKTGKTTSIVALDSKYDDAAKKILTPQMANFVFTPASVSGKPVATSIILYIKGVKAPSNEEKSVPLFMAEASAQAAPKLAKPYEGKDSVKIKCFLGLEQKGAVSNVRISGDVPAGLALSAMLKLRNWGNPAHFEWDCKRTIAVVEFELNPGSGEFKLLGEGRPIEFTPPKVTKLGAFRNAGLIIDSFDNATYRYTLGTDGKPGEIDIVKSTNEKYAARMKAFIKETTYSPAIIEGEPVECQIDEITGLKIGEYWSNTDALKW